MIKKYISGLPHLIVKSIIVVGIVIVSTLIYSYILPENKHTVIHWILTLVVVYAVCSTAVMMYVVRTVDK